MGPGVQVPDLLGRHSTQHQALTSAERFNALITMVCTKVGRCGCYSTALNNTVVVEKPPTWGGQPAVDDWRETLRQLHSQRDSAHCQSM